MSSEGSSSDGSDIEMQSALPKMPPKKLPNSPSDDFLKKKQEKKLTTKTMVQQALTDLKSRKGVSVYAIKKYIGETYNVDTEKLNHYIKKFIKSAVEGGIIIQTKGIGATGSFKLAPINEKKPKTQKPKKVENTEKIKDPKNKKALKEKPKETEGKILKPKVKSKEGKDDKPVKPKKMIGVEKKPKSKKNGGENSKKAEIAKDKLSKKKAMIKRKSIGSIIKPPKMNPKTKS